MRERSLVRLVVRRLVALALLYTAVLALFVYIHIDDTLNMLRDKTLTEHARRMASYLEEENGEIYLDLPAAKKEFYETAGRFHQYAIRDGSGAVLFESPVFYLDRFPAPFPEGGPVMFNFRGPQGTYFLGVGLPFELDGRKYYIHVAQSEEYASEYSDFLRYTFLRRMALYDIPFLILLVAVIIYSIRTSLSPISRASEHARAITFRSPDVRIEERDIPKEVKPLVQAVNKAFDRLEKGIQAQKTFTANAAHELRTPLAILQSHADLVENSEVAKKLREDISSMSRLVSQLLDAARVDFGEGLEFRPSDLRKAVQELCTVYWPLMVKQSRRLDVSGIEGSPVFVNGHYDSILRALRNILDNAMLHTPRGKPIGIALEGTTVRIRDWGPGIPDNEKEKVFEKFWRKSSRSDTGAGLGLSIVKRTMELHGGTVHVEDAPGGGSIFVLSFPASGETGYDASHEVR